MRNEFTAIIEKEDDWYISWCAEIPGANGQGKSKEESLRNLSQAVELILEDRREDSLRGISDEVAREKLIVECNGKTS